MHKEVIIVLTLFFVPALIVMAIANEGAVIRTELVNVYMDYPPKFDVTPQDKALQEQVRSLLLSSSHEDFFNPNGLTCRGYEYFWHTRQLVHSLLRSSCIMPLTNSFFVRADGLSTELSSCGLVRAEDAYSALVRVIEINNNLVETSVNNYACDDGREALELAKYSAGIGNYDAMVDFWVASWRRSTSCICG